MESLRGFEKNSERDKASVEAVMNLLHMADLHSHGCKDITEQRIVYLGQVLKEIYTAKLAWQFPDRPCEVLFYEPDNRADLIGYQITFWQRKHVESGAAPNHAAGTHPGSSGGQPSAT